MGYGNVAPAPVMSTASAEWLATPKAISSSAKRSRNAEKYIEATLQLAYEDRNTAVHTTEVMLQLRYGHKKETYLYFKDLSEDSGGFEPTSAVRERANRLQPPQPGAGPSRACARLSLSS